MRKPTGSRLCCVAYAIALLSESSEAITKALQCLKSLGTGIERLLCCKRKFYKEGYQMVG
jgi:hypothetical protein